MRRFARNLRGVLLAAGIGSGFLAAGCGVNGGGGVDAVLTPPAGSEGLGNDLQAMRTARISVGGAAVEVWIAETRTQLTRGLMFVSAEQMQPLPDGTPRGMLFWFEDEQELDFWMRNTYIPLDLAYARTDGTILRTYTMEPLDTSLGKHVSGAPARFALEVNGGLFSELGIFAGDVIDLPQDLRDSLP